MCHSLFSDIICIIAILYMLIFKWKACLLKGTDSTVAINCVSPLLYQLWLFFSRRDLKVIKEIHHLGSNRWKNRSLNNVIFNLYSMCLPKDTLLQLDYLYIQWIFDLSEAFVEKVKCVQMDYASPHPMFSVVHTDLIRNVKHHFIHIYNTYH